MTIFKNNGKIYLNYIHDNERKKRSTKLTWNDKNLKFVKENIVPKLEKALECGTPKNKTFNYYGDMFLVSQDKKQSYLAKETYWKKAINIFKDKDIDDISALEVQRYIDNLNIKAKSKKVYLFALRETFRMAVLDGVLKYNPASDINCGKDRREEIKYFEVDELSKVFESAKSEIDEFQNYLLIVANTGIRPEEALGLKWSDFKDDYITISRAKTKNRFVPTKTFNGLRKVPFKLSELLKRNNDTFLFPNQNDISHFRHQWKRTLKKAEVPYRAIKNLRHTYATQSLKNTAPINTISAVLGHSSPRTTLTHYASIIKGDKINDDRLFSFVHMDVHVLEKGIQKAQ